MQVGSLEPAVIPVFLLARRLFVFKNPSSVLGSSWEGREMGEGV